MIISLSFFLLLLLWNIEENSYYAAARELKNVQRSIKELERRNNELATELEKAKQATNESVNISKNHVRRIQQLENELSQVKHMNQSLMEENESFQRLIFEKTMKGEFMFNPIMQVNISGLNLFPLIVSPYCFIFFLTILFFFFT